MTPKELLEFKYKNSFKKGKQIKKIPKPWSKSCVVYQCDNGYQIVELPKEDWALEGYFMGHCLGGKNSPLYGIYWSLRDEIQTPHVTIYISENIPTRLIGRCNKYPNDKYVKIINEYCKSHKINEFLLHESNEWGKEGKEENQYHLKGILNDKDYRDLDNGELWRDKEWKEKRELI